MRPALHQIYASHLWRGAVLSRLCAAVEFKDRAGATGALCLCMARSPLIQGIKAEPGDAIIFTEQLLHGTLPWNVPEHDRMTLFYKFSPHGVSSCHLT
eukprot:COSAG06_NODE_802_length_12194_cov_5.561637_14_plen_98_part_00